MIKLDGSTQRIFHFPADPETALEYFSDLSRVAYHLPHITVVEVYETSKIRVHYQSVELGAYTINVFTDLHSVAAPEENAIHIRPLKDKTPTEAKATLNATTGYGYFASTALFQRTANGCSIDYRLRIVAQLPRPSGLRMMPGRVVNRIAESISQGRVKEIADGFMANAIEAFPRWQAIHQEPILSRQTNAH